jgi:hypothetical protein
LATTAKANACRFRSTAECESWAVNPRFKESPPYALDIPPVRVLNP